MESHYQNTGGGSDGGDGFESLAAGRRVAIMGQLLFALWAWAYSTLHPFTVGK